MISEVEFFQFFLISTPLNPVQYLTPVLSVLPYFDQLLRNLLLLPSSPFSSSLFRRRYRFCNPRSANLSVLPYFDTIQRRLEEIEGTFSSSLFRHILTLALYS